MQFNRNKNLPIRPVHQSWQRLFKKWTRNPKFKMFNDIGQKRNQAATYMSYMTATSWTSKLVINRGQQISHHSERFTAPCWQLVGVLSISTASLFNCFTDLLSCTCEVSPCCCFKPRTVKLLFTRRSLSLVWKLKTHLEASSVVSTKLCLDGPPVWPQEN